MPKANSRRLDKDEKNVLVHLLQAPKLTNGDIARILNVDERTITRRRKQLNTLGHLSPERNVKGAEKLHEWQLEKVIALLEEQPDLQLKSIQEFLQKEYDLKVTVSTISRQLSRANKARATRPGYKGKRPDLQQPLGSQQVQPPQAENSYASGDAGGDAGTMPARRPQLTEEPSINELQSPAVAQSTTPLLRLKCPYYACNPQRYASHPYCQSAWPTARDVKDHVCRQHSTPKFRCNRCMENFDDNTALVLHQRAPEPCPWREWVVPEGIDDELKEKLRRGGAGDEVEKWRKMFRAIFPGTEDLPDPVVYENAYLRVIDPTLGSDVASPVAILLGEDTPARLDHHVETCLESFGVPIKRLALASALPELPHVPPPSAIDVFDGLHPIGYVDQVLHGLALLVDQPLALCVHVAHVHPLQCSLVLAILLDVLIPVLLSVRIAGEGGMDARKTEEGGNVVERG
ncbi:hypothetical protein VP1G_08937 [Cytospora mali]|uniref:C2H2-type domain-containing protein n=1 Tax=Cytospora mali TaxID=578113 RepID=A0A194VD28_CYTMA|nr:hypothetical protein VP1G_08937 [Valsa mali var. pyri (nom. inval.)]